MNENAEGEGRTIGVANLNRALSCLAVSIGWW